MSSKLSIMSTSTGGLGIIFPLELNQTGTPSSPGCSMMEKIPWPDSVYTTRRLKARVMRLALNAAETAERQEGFLRRMASTTGPPRRRIRFTGPRAFQRRTRNEPRREPPPRYELWNSITNRHPALFETHFAPIPDHDSEMGDVTEPPSAQSTDEQPHPGPVTVQVTINETVCLTNPNTSQKLEESDALPVNEGFEGDDEASIGGEDDLIDPVITEETEEMTLGVDDLSAITESVKDSMVIASED
ncbi:hypothetical protein BDQ17DRAFT_1327389 [Cyathus striatus]|nr:hypothetical protein BDQ17DRAFT_1327389 [Cyathus striatus]